MVISTKKTDPDVNQHGRKLLEICRSNKLIPLNMLIYNSCNYDGGFTFKRGILKSQNDWFLCSKNFIHNVKQFRLIATLSNITDHVPIQVKIHLKTPNTLDHINQKIDEIVDPKNNHSRVRKIKSQNTNLNVFTNMMETQIERIKISSNQLDAMTLCSDIEISIQKTAKFAMTKKGRNSSKSYQQHN